MKHKVKLILMVAALALVLLTPAAWGQFINGGFENGDFSGWTKNGGYWYGGSYYWTGDPGKSAIVTPGTDFYTNNALQMVAYGNYAARVNNYDGNYHFSTLSQTVSNWSDPGVYFAWAAVLEEPGNVHPESDAPHFKISLFDNTTNTTLYSKAFNVYNAGSTGITWKKGYYDGYNQWWYNDWVIASLDASGVQGHTLTLEVLAADCGWGGHGGYAYVDGFGGSPPPPPPPPVPVPASIILLGSGLAGLAGFSRRRPKA